MTQYNTWNVKLSNSQLNRLKSGIKNGYEVTLKTSLHVAGQLNDENNFLYQLLLINTQFSKLRKAFCKRFINYHKIIKIGQLGGFLGRLLQPLLKTGLPLIENVLKPLAKSILLPFRLTAAHQQHQIQLFIKQILYQALQH